MGSNQARVRILTVETYDDDTTRRMLASLYEGPEFSDCDIEHCFTGKASDAHQLYTILAEAVSDFKPDVVFFHDARHIVEDYIDELPEIIERLKTTVNTPDFVVGIQNRELYLEELRDILSDRADIVELEEKFFEGRD